MLVVHIVMYIHLGLLVPGGYEYGDLDLQVEGVFSNETVKYDHEFYGTWTRE
jgi:hypothetical protein